jgi:hypothetical protein
METAKKEILELLAEQKIEVSEAERLLAALEERDRKGGRRPEPRLRRDLNQALASVQESLSGLGPQLKRAFGSAETAADLDLDLDFNLDDEPLGEEVPLEAGGISLPEGCELRIEHKPEMLRGGADLELIPSPDDLLRIHGEGTEKLRLFKSARGPAIRWQRGPLQVEVPALVAETRVRLVGGDLSASEVPGSLSAKIAGGDTEIRRPGGDFRLQCVGGRLNLDLGAGWTGHGKVNSVGGEVEARLDRGIPGGRIEAKAIGAEIILRSEFEGAEADRTTTGQRLRLDFGDPKAAARLRIKTIGGDLTLERS